MIVVNEIQALSEKARQRLIAADQIISIIPLENQDHGITCQIQMVGNVFCQCTDDMMDVARARARAMGQPMVTKVSSGASTNMKPTPQS